jgi:hypothetical protein
MSGMKLIRYALLVILCFVGSMAIGYLSYGTRIFQPNLVFFQFIASGVIASVAVVVIETRGVRWLLLVFLVLFLAFVLLTRSRTSFQLLRAAVAVGAVIGSVWISMIWDRVFPRVWIGKFVLWAAVFGFVHFVSIALLGALLGTFDLGASLLGARLGTMIGAGVGLGYEISQMLGGRLDVAARVPHGESG